jgi:hypothetical protein
MTIGLNPRLARIEVRLCIIQVSRDRGEVRPRVLVMGA